MDNSKDIKKKKKRAELCSSSSLGSALGGCATCLFPMGAECFPAMPRAGNNLQRRCGGAAHPYPPHIFNPFQMVYMAGGFQLLPSQGSTTTSLTDSNRSSQCIICSSLHLQVSQQLLKTHQRQHRRTRHHHHAEAFPREPKAQLPQNLPSTAQL